jgi:uncharacterized protein YjdB
VSVRCELLAALLVVCLSGAACQSASEPEKGGRLERLTIGPRQVRRTVGEAQHFTATGHYAGGATRNLTQRVVYASSDPAIAHATNTKGDRSRIDAVAPGTATITAREPKTGVTSNAGGGDASFTVLGALQRIALAPSVITRIVGQTQHLTATGSYAGGTTRNLTQRLVYRSSNPEVAAAPNAKGDKSRIDMIGVGTATISATDPASGISSSVGGGDVTVVVAPSNPGP